MNRREFIFGSACCALIPSVKCDDNCTSMLSGEDIAKIHDIVKCRKDIVHFAEKYIKITTAKNGVVNVQLKDWQKKYLRHLAAGKSAILSAYRQSGKTMTNVIYAIWKTVFNSHQKVTFVTANRHLSEAAFVNAQMMFELLPEWMKARDRENERCMHSAKHVMMKNGSELVVTYANADFRGYDPGNTLILDEYDSFTAKQVENIGSFYPVLTSHEKYQLIMASTPSAQDSLFSRCMNYTKTIGFLGVFNIVKSQVAAKC